MVPTFEIFNRSYLSFYSTDLAEIFTLWAEICLYCCVKI